MSNLIQITFWICSISKYYFLGLPNLLLHFNQLLSKNVPKLLENYEYMWGNWSISILLLHPPRPHQWRDMNYKVEIYTACVFVLNTFTMHDLTHMICTVDSFDACHTLKIFVVVTEVWVLTCFGKGPNFLPNPRILVHFDMIGSHYSILVSNSHPKTILFLYTIDLVHQRQISTLGGPLKGQVYDV